MSNLSEAITLSSELQIGRSTYAFRLSRRELCNGEVQFAFWQSNLDRSDRFVHTGLTDLHSLPILIINRSPWRPSPRDSILTNRTANLASERNSICIYHNCSYGTSAPHSTLDPIQHEHCKCPPMPLSSFFSTPQDGRTTMRHTNRNYDTNDDICPVAVACLGGECGHEAHHGDPLKRSGPAR